MKKGKDGIYNKYIKRISDFTVSLIALAVLSPLFVILIITGAIAMKGNPFFVQERPGKINPKTGKEKIFKLIKFRTMSNAEDKNGNLLPSNQRLTGYGKFLRKTSLDELGQLVNILVGDMSFIGPRPLLVKYLPLYTQEQHQRHAVLPGLSGYAQAVGRNSLTWEEKFLLDVEYVNNVTIGFDVKILYLTVVTVLKHENVDSTSGTIVEEFKGCKEKEKAL